MAKVIIIGNSSSGFSCCEALIKNSSYDITVITQEKFPAYKRHMLADYIAGDLPENDLYLCNEDYYSQNKINFLKETKVARIDTKKQAVVLKDNNRLNYDFLVIASGRKINIPDIPGRTKRGVFTVNELETAKGIKNSLIIAHTICIIGDSEQSLRFIDYLLKKEKEIKVIGVSSHESFAGQQHIEWMDNLGISEIIGEGTELKAVKLSNGKAIGVDLVLFTSGFSPCAEFLKDTEVGTENGYIIVDDTQCTNFKNIFACGSVCKKAGIQEREKPQEEKINEGIIAANQLIQLTERGKELCQQTS